MTKNHSKLSQIAWLARSTSLKSNRAWNWSLKLLLFRPHLRTLSNKPHIVKVSTVNTIFTASVSSYMWMIILFNCCRSRLPFNKFSSGFTNWIIQIRCHWNSNTISLSLLVLLFSSRLSHPFVRAWPNTNSIPPLPSPEKQHWWRCKKQASRNLIIPQNLFQCCLTKCPQFESSVRLLREFSRWSFQRRKFN